MTTSFASLALANPLLRALTDEGYSTPTPIQAEAIPHVLGGRDILGCAQTGTGKTAAFALPVLHRLFTAPADMTRRGPALPRALVLSPTRELATQIADSFQAYGRHTALTGTCIFGGVSQHRQVKALQRGVDIVVATPGRLIDLLEQRLVNLSAVEVLVLDEADRMLDMGFIQPIRQIAAAVPAGRQTLLFSATMPKEIVRLAESLLKNPARVAVTPVASAAPLIDQSVYMVSRHSKQALLEHTLESGKIGRALVFTRTKHGADRVMHRLVRAGITAQAIHGNKAQNQRQRALDAFRTGRTRVLVATDVAARGIDVDGVTHVFNFDIPNEPEAYVHRIGRTGRAGATGIAISFCDAEERGFLRNIERLTGKPLRASATPNLPKPTPDHAAALSDARTPQRPAERRRTIDLRPATRPGHPTDGHPRTRASTHSKPGSSAPKPSHGARPARPSSPATTPAHARQHAEHHTSTAPARAGGHHPAAAPRTGPMSRRPGKVGSKNGYPRG